MKRRTREPDHGIGGEQSLMKEENQVKQGKQSRSSQVGYCFTTSVPISAGQSAGHA